MGEASTIHSSPTPLTPAGAPTNGFSARIVVGTTDTRRKEQCYLFLNIILNESRK